MTEKPVDILVDLVSAAGKRGLAFNFALKKLEEKLQEDGCSDAAERARKMIRDALDNWIVDKIIDDAASVDESPTLGHVWLLRILSKDESRVFQELPPVKKAFLKVLRESEWDGSIGVIKESLALEKLREQGFDIEHVPYISERTGIFVEVENGKSVPYYYLLPEDERSEEFKASMKEADEKLMEREWREDRAIAREEAQERRKAARKKKITVEKKKTSIKKKPE